MALEDAAVLSKLLVTRETLGDDLWQAFTGRRYARVHWVVEASSQLCQWLLDGVQGDMPHLVHQLTSLVSQPA